MTDLANSDSTNATDDPTPPLLIAHGLIHIIFWSFFLLLHVSFMVYKRNFSHTQFIPPNDKSFKIYMAVHHVLGVIDISAICMVCVCVA